MPEKIQIHYRVMTEAEKRLVYNTDLVLSTFPYMCAGCGHSVRGRVLADASLGEDVNGYNRYAYWCLCACGQPTCVTLTTTAIGQPVDSRQFPNAREFRAGENWPADQVKLFEEAALSFGNNAYTATAMVCRKILMVCAVAHEAKENESFTYYVDFVTNNILSFPKAKTAIDAIRDIGNDANHEIAFVDPAQARRAMEIVTYTLNAIYSLPGA